MAIVRFLGLNGTREPQEYDPREEARLGRQAIKASAWNLLKREQLLQEIAATAMLAVSHTAVRSIVSPSFLRQVGFETSNPMTRPMRHKTNELKSLQAQKLDALKDFFLTLKVLVPLDPGLRGIETTEDPVGKLIDRARQWVVPVEVDAYQFDQDYYEQSVTNQ